MLWLKANTEKIRELVKANTPESLTYAAMESRLAIEMVCYERLRNAHDLISHEDIKKWQPRGVVNTLIREVDDKIASDFTLSMSKEPTTEKEGDYNQEDFEKLEYVEIGKQVGIDARKLGKLWNALSSFLHVKIPRTKNDELNLYGDLQVLRRKLEEALEELERLSQGTLIMSGMGETVSIKCHCGSTSKRSSALLNEGHQVSCFNPDCPETWTVLFEKNEIIFRLNTISIECKGCEKPLIISKKSMLDLKLDQVAHTVCECGENNYVRWKLMQEKRPNTIVP